MTFKQFLTPDGTTIAMSVVPYKQAREIVETDRSTEELLRLSFFQHRYYRLKNGQVLFEKTLDSSYYLSFQTEGDFQRFRKGEKYIETSLFLDSAGRTYIAFTLDPANAIEFKDKATSKDSSYVDRNSNLPNILYYLPGDHCVWMYHRFGNLYDGYWFVDFESFRYCYDNVF